MKKAIHYAFELLINLPLGIFCLLLASMFDNIDRFAWKKDIEWLKNKNGVRLEEFAEKLVELKWKMHNWAYKEDKV